MGEGNFIVITSIFHPTKAVEAFSGIPGHKLIVIGDNKTPKGWKCKNSLFYPIEAQKSSDYAIAKLLPENHYSRKMFGYVKAMEMGAELIVDTDDDNIPKPGWAFPPFSGNYLLSRQGLGFVNIYKHFTGMNIWPRGLPLAQIKNPKAALSEKELEKKPAKVGVWQALADGDPDVDAIYRLTKGDLCYFDKKEPVVLDSGTLSPFNSQNTAFAKDFFPLLYLPAFVTFRFTDILRGLVAQPIMWLYGYKLGFLGATVTQERNAHDYTKDFESEIPCYLQASKAADIVSKNIRRESSVCENLYSAYQALSKHEIVPEKELDLLSAWNKDVQSFGISK